MLIRWLNIGWCDPESRKFNNILSKLKLGWIQGDAVLSADVQKLTGLEEGCIYAVRPDQRVINAFGVFI